MDHPSSWCISHPYAFCLLASGLMHAWIYHALLTVGDAGDHTGYLGSSLIGAILVFLGFNQLVRLFTYLTPVCDSHWLILHMLAPEFSFS